MNADKMEHTTIPFFNQKKKSSSSSGVPIIVLGAREGAGSDMVPKLKEW